MDPTSDEWIRLVEPITSVIDEVFGSADGAEICKQEKTEKSLVKTDDFVYGEVSSLAFAQLLQHVSPTSSDEFVDLGSGLGRAVAVAGLVFDFHGVSGIEYLKSLHDGATDIAKKLSVAGERLGKKYDPRLYCGDFFEHNWSNYTVIFVNSVCLPMDVFERLVEKSASEVPVGSRLITTLKEAKHPAWRQFHHELCDTSWLWADFYCYEKVTA